MNGGIQRISNVAKLSGGRIGFIAKVSKAYMIDDRIGSAPRSTTVSSTPGFFLTRLFCRAGRGSVAFKTGLQCLPNS